MKSVCFVTCFHVCGLDKCLWHRRYVHVQATNGVLPHSKAGSYTTTPTQKIHHSGSPSQEMLTGILSWQFYCL